MPGMNGTGPAGRGPMTGGGRGWCNPYSPIYGGGYAGYGRMPMGYAPAGYGGYPATPMGVPAQAAFGYGGYGRGYGMGFARVPTGSYGGGRSGGGFGRGS